MKARLRILVPGVLVLAVVLASFTAHAPSLGLRQLNYGYGFGPPPVQYHPLTAARIFDTRDGTGGVPVPLAPNTGANVQVTGQGNVPSSGVTAAVLNVTVTNGTAPSYLTVYPAGATRPLASNLNWTAQHTATNLVEVALGAAGQVTVYNASGRVDVIVDVQGYVSVPVGAPGTQGLYNPLVPSRILDTRIGIGAPAVPVGSGKSLDMQITGADGVPATGVDAVVLNVTAVNATKPSFVTAFPKGAGPPFASNLNFVAGQTVPNRVIVKVGSGGKVSLFNQSGSVDLIADVGGWFTDGSVATAFGSVFIGTTPSRFLDTRTGGGPVGPNSTITLPVTGLGAVPATGVSAVVLNVTVTSPTAPSYLTVWPDLTSRPLASDLNYVSGLTVPNLVIVKVGSNGRIDIYNAAGTTHVIVDVIGWYQGG